MELNWLQSLLYGVVSGLTEFLPVSSLSHQTVILRVMGLENPGVLRLSAHLGAWIALILMNMPLLNRLRRERRLHAMPKKKRRRNPDFGTMMEIRVFQTGMVLVLVSYLAYNLVSGLHQRLWLLAILVAVNGVLLYIPQYLPGANKKAQSLSRLDAVLIGFGAGWGIVPGISATGSALCVGLIRGADRRYATDLALLLCIPGLLLTVVLEALSVVGGPMVLSGAVILNCLTVALASFLSACWAVVLMRFLAVKIGYSGFAYYCWGLALFTLILYLI